MGFWGLMDFIRHHFHADCITKWLKVNGVCPICRKKLEEMGQPEGESAEASKNNIRFFGGINFI